MRDLELGDGRLLPQQLLRAVTSRSGGPGGQNVNKLETKVTIEVEIAALPLGEEERERVRARLRTRISRGGVLRVTSQSERTQLANRDRALSRLESLLREALVVRAPRKPTRVSRAQKERRRIEKKKRAETKRLRGQVGD